MNNFEIVIGIEIHIELNTASKMFSSAPNRFDAPANTNVSLVDVAYPGTLPVVNKAAVVKVIKIAKALQMTIDQQLHFDRKNYFYADLPKGFQITQQNRPIGKEGFIWILDNQKVAIERIHLEEDTARSYHLASYTALDYNRAGTPLIEIVSHPIIHSAQEAVAYIQMIRDTVKILGISDAKMEEGSLRADINISLRPYGQNQLGTKVEIKNLNSLANVAKAIEQEVAKQQKQYLTGQKVMQATKRFDEQKQDVIVMRTKTDAADYRYFAEPNIPIIALDQNWIDSITIPELPWEITKRFRKLKIDDQYIKQLINDPEKLNFINNFSQPHLAQAIKLFFSEIVSFANQQKQKLKALNLDAKQISILIEKLNQGQISGAHVKKIIPLLLTTNDDVATIIKRNNLQQISDFAILEPLIDKIILEHHKFIEDNKDRYERVSKFLLGQIMKVSKGQANPVIASQIVAQKLGD